MLSIHSDEEEAGRANIMWLWTGAVVLLCGVVCPGVQGHGRLMEPPSRGSMWRVGFNTPKDYNDNQLNCGGFAVSLCLFYHNGSSGGGGGAYCTNSDNPSQ